jgi:hypothetical protein
VADVSQSSNHDYTNGFFFVSSNETYFKNCKKYTSIVGIAHRKAFQYHTFDRQTHGDGANDGYLY